MHPAKGPHIAASAHQQKLTTRSLGFMKYLLINLIILIISSQILNITGASAIITTSATPPPRYGHQMVYISAEDVFLLFGGESSYQADTQLTNTWQFDCQQKQWTRLDVQIHPSPRMNHGMVYCGEEGCVFLFGGMSTIDYTFLDDTWVFYLENNTWQNIQTSNAPSNRSDMGCYYDTTLKAPIIFSGYIHDLYRKNDFWMFNFTQQAWELLNTTNTPRSRYGHTIRWEPSLSSAIMVGGRVEGTISDEMWRLNFSSLEWAEMNPSPPIHARYWHAMDISPETQEIYVFGGRLDSAENSSLGDFHRYSVSANEWSEIQLTEGPSPRKLSTLVNRADNGELYLFGGMNNYGERGIGDLWCYAIDSDSWVEIRLDNASPSMPGYSIWALMSCAVTQIIIKVRGRSAR